MRRLSAALDSAEGEAAKQRTVLLADLANAHGDPERSGTLLDQALDVLERDWYATGYERVRVARRALGDAGAAKALDERLEGMSPGAPLQGPAV